MNHVHLFGRGLQDHALCSLVLLRDMLALALLRDELFGRASRREHRQSRRSVKNLGVPKLTGLGAGAGETVPAPNLRLSSRWRFRGAGRRAGPGDIVSAQCIPPPPSLVDLWLRTRSRPGRGASPARVRPWRRQGGGSGLAPRGQCQGWPSRSAQKWPGGGGLKGVKRTACKGSCLRPAARARQIGAGFWAIKSGKTLHDLARRYRNSIKALATLISARPVRRLLLRRRRRRAPSLRPMRAAVGRASVCSSRAATRGGCRHVDAGWPTTS